MFEALTKAIHDVQEKDDEKILKRMSKRISTKAPDDTTSRKSLKNDEEDENDEDKKDEYPDQNSAQEIESDIEEDDDDLLEDRDKWANDYIAIIHMIAFAVGGSNIWRFGFLVSQNGGIAFMVPYIFLTAVCAFPTLYLELLIGQYAQVGCVAAWKLLPLFKGVGMCMLLLAFMALFNIQTMVAWCLFYIFQATFYHPLPWISCDNGFDKMSNGQRDPEKVKWVAAEEHADQGKNWHTENCTEFYADAGTDGNLKENERLPGGEFFRGRVQRMWKSGYEDSEEIDETTGEKFAQDNGVVMFGLDTEQGLLEYNADTFISLVAVFVLLKLACSRGIRLNSTVMFLLTLYPYVILLMIFFRATGLNGAWSGLKQLFKPDFGKIVDSNTWWKCAEQVFYSTGAGFGIHLTLASHNKFNRRVVYDAAIVVVVNSVTSILIACTMFMFLGHVSVTVNRSLDDFVRSGPELVFEVMSDVLGVLAKANFYAFSFYLFIFLVTFTTVISTRVCFNSAFVEVLPVSVKYRAGTRVMVMTMIQILSFIISSLNLTRGGLHTYYFFNTYTGLYTLVLCAFLFLVGISWFFGLREIVEATSEMGVRAPGIFYQLCWKFFCPLVLAIVFIGLLFDPDHHGVSFDQHEITLGTGLYVFGYIIALGPFLGVVSGVFHAFWKAPGKTCKQKLLTCISPTREHDDILLNGTGKRATFKHYFYLYAQTPGSKCNVCCVLLPENKVGPEPGEEPELIAREKKRRSKEDGKNAESQVPTTAQVPIVPDVEAQVPKGEAAPEKDTKQDTTPSTQNIQPQKKKTSNPDAVRRRSKGSEEKKHLATADGGLCAIQ